MLHNTLSDEQDEKRKLQDAVAQLSSRLETFEQSRERVYPTAMTPGARTSPYDDYNSVLERRGADGEIIPRAAPQAICHLGNTVPDVPKLKPCDGLSVEDRMYALQTWMFECRHWVAATCDDGERLWVLIKKALTKFHQEWLELSGNPRAQSNYSFNRIQNGGDEAERFRSYCSKACPRILSKIPITLNNIYRDHMQDISVDSPFQSLTGVFVTAFCEYGITCLQDAVALARAVEYPRDKVIYLNGDEYHRALRRWWQLVDFASGLYSIDWAHI